MFPVRPSTSFAFRLVAAALAVACVSLPAQAGDPRDPQDAKDAKDKAEADLALARERFAAARKAEDAGKWSDALALLQRVAEVKMTPQVRFHIALCMENIGLWTQALDGFAQAASEAGSGAPEVVKESNDHLRKLETSIPTVSLRVDGAAPNDELYLDRRRIPIDDRPLPIRADPGPHAAEVRRGGTVIAREYFALEARTTRRIELKVGTVAPAPNGSETPDPAVKPPPNPPLDVKQDPPPQTPPPEQPPVPAPPDGRGQRIAGGSVIGVGAASLVVAGVFIGLRAGEMNRLEKECPGLTHCSPSVASIVSAGKTDATLVNVFGVLGGLATAAGIVVVATAPSAPPAPVRAEPQTLRLELSPIAGPTVFGFATRGVF